MKTLTLQKNKLILAGLLACVVLFFTQITVLAYDYGGGWGAVRTVGGAGVQWLNIGSSLVDADINVGEMPSVSTGTPTNVGMNGGTHATLNAEITSMGVATDTYTSFQYSTDLSFSQSTPEVVQAVVGTYSATITGFLPNQLYNVRAVNRVGAVSTYGATQTFYTSATATFNLLDSTIILVVVALIFFILSMMLLPAEIPFIFRIILITVGTYFVLAILPGLQNLLSALQ